MIFPHTREYCTPCTSRCEEEQPPPLMLTAHSHLGLVSVRSPEGHELVEFNTSILVFFILLAMNIFISALYISTT